jgi:peptide/nickel transport system substrate-binding protein
MPIARHRLFSVRRTSAAALLLTLSVGACGPGEKPTVTGDTGGTMIVVAATEPKTLFPPRADASDEFAVIASVFDRLAEIGPDLSTYGDAGFTPRLAKSWTWAPDSLSIAFNIDPRARWHDGQPVRAEDVQFSFHVYTSDAVASIYRPLLGNIDSVSVRDSLTAVMWFKRRTPQQFMDATYTMFILPSHLLASMPDSALAAAPFGKQPVGTGRFRFARWDNGARIEIVADTVNARGRAKLDRVIWTFVGDAGAATVKLFAGEADFYQQMRPEDIAQMGNAPQYRLQTNLPLRYQYMGFNTRVRRAPVGPTGTPHPVLGDVRVRRALTMALDREKMVRTVLDSLGMVPFSAAPRVLIPDTSALRPIPYNVAAAKALLDSAGWASSAPDGIRVHDGQRLSFELLVPSTSPNRIKLSVLIQAALKEVGAEAKLLTLEPPALGPRVDARDFDAYLGAWDANPGLQGTRQTWSSRGPSNSQSYTSPVFDAYLDSAYAAFDQKKGRTYWTRAFQQIIDDAPSVWLYEQRQPVAVHKRLRLAPLRADGWYANLADWSVDPTQRIKRDEIGLGGAR